jgi:hypothetical protein
MGSVDMRALVVVDPQQILHMPETEVAEDRLELRAEVSCSSWDVWAECGWDEEGFVPLATSFLGLMYAAFPPPAAQEVQGRQHEARHFIVCIKERAVERQQLC